MKEINIKIGKENIRAELNETITSGEIWKKLPIKAEGQLWGEEIYFEIPVGTEGESLRGTVERGDIAYWPPGHAFCIFFGPTPMSSNDEIKPASEVEVIGRLTAATDLPEEFGHNREITIEKNL